MSAGQRTDLSSDGPAQETMAEPQAAPPSESTDHKHEHEPAAGVDVTPQSSTEEGRKIIMGQISQELWRVSGLDFTVCQGLVENTRLGELFQCKIHGPVELRDRRGPESENIGFVS